MRIGNRLVRKSDARRVRVNGRTWVITGSGRSMYARLLRHNGREFERPDAVQVPESVQAHIKRLQRPTRIRQPEPEVRRRGRR